MGSKWAVALVQFAHMFLIGKAKTPGGCTCIVDRSRVGLVDHPRSVRVLYIDTFFIGASDAATAGHGTSIKKSALLSHALWLQLTLWSRRQIC